MQVVLVLLVVLLILAIREAYATKVYWFGRKTCPYCRSMEDEWSAFEGRYDFTVKTIRVDTDTEAGDALFKNFGGKTVPHIVKQTRDGTRTVYDGERTRDAFHCWARGTPLSL